MKSKLSKNAIIGLTFIVSLVMLYFGVNYLKGVNVFKKRNVYYAVFENVSKLYVSSPIFVKGFQVGLVHSIKIKSVDPLLFVVEMNMSEGFKIRDESRLEFGVDIFGASTVNLIMPETGAFLQPGDTIPGYQEADILDGVVKIAPRADMVLIRVDSLVWALNKLMSNPMWEKSIEGIGVTVQELNSSGQKLNSILNSVEKDLPEISQNLSAVSGDLKEVSSKLNELELQKTFASIDEAVENLKILSTKLNSSDNSLGLLMNDRQLYDSINSTLNSTTKLLEDIRLNPEKYLSIKLRLF